MGDCSPFLLYGPRKDDSGVREASSSGDPNIFSTLRNLVFLLAIYSYFTGWLYAFYFYSQFGISLNSLDTPFYAFFVYSYTVVTNLIGFLVVIIGSGLIFTFVRLFPNKFAVVLVAVLFFPAFVYAAQTAAANEARLRRIGYATTVAFVFKPDVAKSYSKSFICLNKTRQLKLLTQTKDKYYVFHQPGGEGEGLPFATTYDISRSDVVLVEIDVQ
jgi:hypothetical protein